MRSVWEKFGRQADNYDGSEAAKLRLVIDTVTTIVRSTRHCRTIIAIKHC